MAEKRKPKFYGFSVDCLQACLHEFVECNNVEAIKFSVEKGACVNTENRAGITPLHLAAMSNSTLQCSEELLKSATVDINKQSDFGLTAVAHSSKTGSDKILKKLIEFGADVSLGNFEKRTPLHFACLKNCFKAVKLLVKAGANVNATDIRNSTPLHEAATSGSAKVCQFLLQHGANAGIPNQDGWLPIHIAVSKQNCEVYDVIRSNTTYDALMTHCTFPGPYGVDKVNRSIVCLALKSCNKALVEKVLESGLPDEVLNCPVVVEQPYYEDDYLGRKWPLNFFGEKMVLFTPVCFLLINYCDFTPDDFVHLLSLIHNKRCMDSVIHSKYNKVVCIPGCIEAVLCSSCTQIEKFKLINMLLENRADVDDDCIDIPFKTLILCLKLELDISIFIFLLKASNVVEPEDILRWIIPNKKGVIIKQYVPQDIVYALLVMSPYFIMSPRVYKRFLQLKIFGEDDVSKKIQEIYEHPVRPLTSYCRSVIRRQLHCESKEGHMLFTEKLNSLPIPKLLISYLKFNEIKYDICESVDTEYYHVI